MKDYTELTGGGQFRRMRRAAWAALERYGVARDDALRLSPLVHGENTTFRLRVPKAHALFRAHDTTDFAVRIHRLHYQTRTSILSELEWTRAIQADLGIETPLAITALDGERVVDVDVEGVPGQRHVVVFRWLYGRFRTRGVTLDEIAERGETMARLHNHSASWSRPEGFTRHVWLADQMLPDDALWRDALAKLPRDTASLLEEARAALHSELTAWGQNPRNVGLVHADLHAWNVLYHKDGMRVLDFDDAGTSYWMQDIATGVMSFHDNAERLAAFVRGYRSQRALSEADWATLPTFVTVRQLFELRWVLERRDNPNVWRWFDSCVARCTKAARGWLGASAALPDGDRVAAPG